jgi:hypothetical protein
MEEKPRCDVCEHFADRESRPTPCRECLPELMLENSDVWRIYAMVSGQLIIGAAGPLGINHNAIHKAMELYEIENKRDCFERVCAISEHMLKLNWEKRKSKDA